MAPSRDFPTDPCPCPASICRISLACRTVALSEGADARLWAARLLPWTTVAGVAVRRRRADGVHGSSSGAAVARPRLLARSASSGRRPGRRPGAGVAGDTKRCWFEGVHVCCDVDVDVDGDAKSEVHRHSRLRPAALPPCSAARSAAEAVPRLFARPPPSALPPPAGCAPASAAGAVSAACLPAGVPTSPPAGAGAGSSCCC